MLKLVATDLDGTFLNDDKSISADNLKALEKLGERSVLRVIATGRNLPKTREVIPDNIPFDFIVFSSGAGVYDWKNQRHLFHQNMPEEMVNALMEFLVSKDVSFHLFKPVPDNHQCWFHRGNYGNEEFERYYNYHLELSEEIPLSRRINQEASQFLIILPNDAEAFHRLKGDIEKQFKEVKVVRTSSPLDTGYIWMEIFHQSVSKGNGVRFICEKHNIDHSHTLGIGNDFNDIDLLNFTCHSYVVEDSPPDMKNQYRVGRSNRDNAFAHIIQEYL